MFVSAIERAAEFTRPIHTILRYFESTEVRPGAATFFFVNADGWALTCKHVAQQLPGAVQIAQRYQAYKAERAILPSKNRRQHERDLVRKYKFGPEQLVEMKNRLICGEGPVTFSWILHPTLDVALPKFSNFTKLSSTSFPTFLKDGGEVKQGKFLCRLGFPFAEFGNFAYDSATDTIDWTTQGRQDTPRFPIEGMVTRYLLDAAGATIGFELSTPGLRGQSGGPAFDTEGRVWGMQCATAHLDLDFDVKQEVVRNGIKERVEDSAFLHVGHCVHVDVLKAFMREHAVAFSEG